MIAFWFCEADRENCRTVTQVFDLFCEASGQRVNKNKLKIFFSNNVTEDDRSNMEPILDISNSNDLGKHLGFPLNGDGRATSKFASQGES